VETSGYPPTTNEFAAEGTMLHEVADECLRTGAKPHSFIGKAFKIEGFEFIFNKDHADCMVEGLFEIRDIFQGGVVYSENRYDLSAFIRPGESGTADVAGTDWRGVIHVLDWKFGEGVKVDAEWNFQGMLYALGYIHQYHTDAHVKAPETPVHIHILQPRIANARSTFITSVGELYAWVEDFVRPKIAEIEEQRGTFVPGKKQCRFCPARSGNADLGREPCPAYIQYNLDYARKIMPDLDIASAMGTEVTVSKVYDMTPEQRVWLYDNREMITEFLKDVAARLRSDLERGQYHLAPGKKLVDGRRGDRVFMPQHLKRVAALAEKQLGAEAYTTTMLSPAQLEARLGKQTFDLMFGDYITQSPPQAVIVDMSDPKPAREVRVLKDVFPEI
jgi:hypothetical protein